MKITDVVTSKAKRDQIESLRERVRLVEAQNRKLHISLGSQRELGDAIRSACIAAEPFQRASWKVPSGKPSSAEAVFVYSDWHTGDRIKPNEIEGVNSYSWSIQQERLWYILSQQLRWIQTQRSGYRIDRAWVFGLGDWVSGNCVAGGRELVIHAEFPSPVQAVNAGTLLGELLCRMAAHFHEVCFVGVGADNHGRLDMKPQFKEKALNSWSYVTHEVARSYAKNVANLKFEIAEGAKHLVTVAQHNFLLEHGDMIRGWAGFPYYGIGRLKGKEAVKRMRLALSQWRQESRREKREYGFDYHQLAHFHVPAIIEGDTIINGSLSGTSELDHAQGRYSPPAQLAYLVHRRHGIFNFTPFSEQQS